VRFLLAQKIGMTSIFDTTDNSVVPVTLLQAGPCVVTQVKTPARDGYAAVQVGFGEAKNIGKSRAGHLKASKATSRHLAEYRLDKDGDSAASVSEDDAETKAIAVGDTITASIFAVGDRVTVRGTSKGKGFAGTIKRHNFHRGPKTHGSHNYRAPGSIGAGFPQHVMRGMKMAGHMGVDTVTTKNLPIVMIDEARNLIAVRGAVPGPKRGIISLEAREAKATSAEKVKKGATA